MKHLRGALFWLIAAMMAIGAVLIWGRGEVHEGKPLIALNPESITKFEIDSKIHGKSVIERRGKKSWRMVQPVNAPANNDLFNSLCGRFQFLKIEEELDESVIKKEEFGLKEPQMTLVIHTKEGKRYKLLLGNRVPASLSDAYAMLEGQSKPVAITGSLLDDVQRKVDDLRDKRLTRLKKENAVKLALTYPDRTLVCEKRGKDWHFVEPLKVPADSWKVEELLGNIDSLQAYRFVDDRPEDLSQYGLDKPAFRAEVWLKGRKEPLTLSAGKQYPDDKTKFYAKSSRSRSVFLVEDFNLKNLKKQLADLRSKKVFVFSTEDVQKLALHHDATEIELVRLKGKDEFEKNWQFSKPIKGKADGWKVEDVLRAMETLEADEFIDQPKQLSIYGLDAPQVRAEVWEKGQKEPKVLLIGRKVQGKSGVYAKSSDSPIVCRVPERVLSELRKGVGDLHSLQVTEFSRDSVEEILMKWGKNRLRLVRKGKDNWLVSEPKKKRASKESVGMILFELENMTADKWIAPRPQKAHGFDKPSMTCEVHIKDKPKPVVITLGKRDAKRKVVFVRSSESEDVFEKRDSLLDTLKQNSQNLIR